MEERMNREIYCKYLEESCYVEFEFRGKEVVWKKFGCWHMNKREQPGQCSFSGKTCGIDAEFHEHIEFVRTLFPRTIR